MIRYLTPVVCGLLVTTVVSAAETPDADLLVGANARIEKYRKVDASITLLNSEGQPIPNAALEVQQTRHAFLFGSNIFLWGHVGTAKEEQQYRDRFAAVFNFATLPFYWPSYERAQGEPRHDDATAVAKWCRDHRITAKGHPLAWNYSDPRWLPDDLDTVRRLQMARIDDCVSRFHGLIDCWDVVNEATHFDRSEFFRRAPKLTAVWQKTGRIPFIQECFQHARKSGAHATLLINDYRVDSAYEKLLSELANDDGEPIFDVIGIQSHMHGGVWSNQKIWDVCERFARFNVPLHFTETTILSGHKDRQAAGQPRGWPSTPQGEEWQANEVERFYTMVFSHPSTAALTWWDFSDRHAWQGAPAGFLRSDLSPKPAYDRLLTLIRDKWWTHLTITTDVNGKAQFRGFLGDYVIHETSTDPDTEFPIALVKGDRNEFTIRRRSNH